MAFTPEQIKELKKRAVDVRADIVEMIPAGKIGHLGGSASIADVTAALYFSKMKVFADPKDPRRDRCVFSKGHAVLAQYACLAELGYFSKEEFKNVKTLHGLLQGHPDLSIPGIEAVTGSLGQGLSVSLGMALATRLDDPKVRVYCILGDGELAEGQVWEAAMAASVYKADNLCAIIDRNGVQATDATEKVFPIPELKAKWAAFGWNVIEIDGHDMASILDALDQAEACKGKPSMILSKTVKGKGFDFAEGKSKYHNAAMTEEEYARAKELIAKMREEV